MSTAKSMANNYLTNKRQGAKLSPPQRFKSSTGSLVSSAGSRGSTSALHRAASSSQLMKASSSMSNLNQPAQQQQQTMNMDSNNNRPHRPASRNALDSIHNGLNAKYAQVQSKVYLQNIKPSTGSSTVAVSSRIPAAPTQQTRANELRRARTGAHTPSGRVPNERSAMLNKLKALQDELDRQELDRGQLEQELEREKSDKLEQLARLKVELEEKMAQHEKQNEEHHQKLLDAYELADQNRRAADQVLAESRARDEENRKRIEELDGQLGELREFVSIKEEMAGKMVELREQIRVERERYEEQLKSLHQVFENEKISLRHQIEQLSLKHQQQQASQQQQQQVQQVQHHSNYFNRLRPNLESSESIDQLRVARTNCRKCQSGSSQLHLSEQDMYGSRLSTRVQEGAKSAWKVSKRFASSLITGGRSISACRKQQQQQQQQQSNANKSDSVSTTDQQAPSATATAAQLTSVVQIEAQQQSQQETSSGTDEQTSQQGDLVVRVDGSNKLTIVTKFNQDELGQAEHSPIGAPCSSASSTSSGGASERSRCESSSSGRGTGSETGSARAPDEASPPATKVAASQPLQQAPKSGRKLFKASRLIKSGSQLSLNKLKTYMTPSGRESRKLKVASKMQQQQQQQSIAVEQSSQELEQDQLESARSRCLELNQAINVASMAPSPNTPQTSELQVPPAITFTVQG